MNYFCVHKLMFSPHSFKDDFEIMYKKRWSMVPLEQKRKLERMGKKQVNRFVASTNCIVGK